MLDHFSDNEIDTENTDGHSDLLFTIKIQHRNSKVFQIQLILMFALNSVQMDPDNQMSLMDDIIPWSETMSLTPYFTYTFSQPCLCRCLRFLATCTGAAESIR